MNYCFQFAISNYLLTVCDKWTILYLITSFTNFLHFSVTISFLHKHDHYHTFQIVSTKWSRVFDAILFEEMYFPKITKIKKFHFSSSCHKSVICEKMKRKRRSIWINVIALFNKQIKGIFFYSPLMASTIAWYVAMTAETGPKMANTSIKRLSGVYHLFGLRFSHNNGGTKKLEKHPPNAPPTSKIGLIFGRNIAMRKAGALEIRSARARFHNGSVAGSWTLKQSELISCIIMIATTANDAMTTMKIPTCTIWMTLTLLGKDEIDIWLVLSPR